MCVGGPNCGEKFYLPLDTNGMPPEIFRTPGNIRYRKGSIIATNQWFYTFVKD
jgi:hypothetical protein